MTRSIEEIKKPNSIVGVGAVESSYLRQTTPSITDYNDPDLPAILVYLVYITQLEVRLQSTTKNQL